MSRICSARRAVVILLASAGLTQSALSATATSHVTIRRAGTSTVLLDAPGTGSNSLNFATGGLVQGLSSGNGSATAGQGRISTFAAAGNFGGNGSGSVGYSVVASASVTDSFTVTAEGNVPLRIEFGMHAGGSVSTVYSDDRWRGGGAEAEVSWNMSLSGGSTSFNGSGRIWERYAPILENGILRPQKLRDESGLSFSEFALVAELGNGQVGQTFTVSMSATAFARNNIAETGHTFSAVADFGNTLRWMGIRSVTLPDGTPYTGALTITSESGFDYTTPTPGAAGLLMTSAALFGSRRRRN